MAISKEILNNKKKTNKPEPLGTVPENNPDHVSRPVDFHHPIPPKPILYNSFDEAVAACELIFLKPGEAHTEFYKIDNTYHCVVAIGNIYANHKHLYLSDSGSSLSIDEQFTLLKDEIIQLSKQFSLLDKHIDDLENKINVFEENLNLGLSEIHLALVELEQFKNDINVEVQRIDNKVNNQATLISALLRQDANINSSINKINSSISYINASIYLNTKDINNLKTHCSNIDSTILSVKNNIQIINASVNLNTEQISEIKEHNTTTDTSIQLLLDNVQIINTSINLNTEQIDEIKEHDLIADASIQLLLNNIKLIGDDIQIINTSVNLNTEQISEIKEHNVIVDASINNLQIEIENFLPIIDASIPPLFHDDVYTVNLCCYTAGGHIEIYDYYDESRVADCTPHNEYKTYVNGDSVDLVAVPNIGYKFVGWAKNADIEHLITDSSIHVGFTDKDINVKGKIINMPLEPVLVQNGYTALFEKLHTISIDIDVNIVGKSGDPVYHGDKFKVIINDIERTDAPYYFEAGSKVQLIPVVIPGHDFNYLTVNYTLQKYYDQYINEHCEEDLFVFANFTEYWSEVTADCQPAGAGQITSEHGIGGTYLYGDQIDLKANVVDGYEFIGWEPEHPTHLPVEKLERDIAPYTLDSSYIVLNINKDITKYELRADFREIVPPGPTATKFTRETIDGITEDKEYIFVVGTNGDEYNIALNANYNSGYFNIYSAYIEGGIDDKDEFEFNETPENPLYVVKLEYDADNNSYYIKNNETGKYIKSASSGNKFVEIDEKDESALWTISDEMKITNNASGKIIAYNTSSPRFTNYSTLSATIIQAHLFYKNNRQLLFLMASNSTPSLQNIVFHEALPEDEN